VATETSEARSAPAAAGTSGAREPAAAAGPGAPAVAASGGLRFAALQHHDFRYYFVGTLLSMMGDNIEHVLSYWVLYERFQSPALAGFAVASHWLPSLLFSVQSGALAGRSDCRKLIQVAQVLFLGVSLGWGVLIYTNTLEMWHALILLMLHGIAVVLWGPASQLILHDMVGRRHLQSAVRLEATARQLGLLFGPGVGGAMLLLFGPGIGLLCNALMYLPLTIWLLRVPYTGHGGSEAAPARRVNLGLGEAWRVLHAVSRDKPLVAMISLTGLTSVLVGNSFGAIMPGLARDLGADQTGTAYSVLLGANAAGAVVGGVLLESLGWLQARARTAIICAALWCLTIAGFALTSSYPLALALLFVAGALHLAFSAIAQTLAQLLPPAEERGRVVGLFSLAQSGLKVGSGVTVGLLGSVIGIHWSLALAALVLLLFVGRLGQYLGRSTSEQARLAA
jgi:MFS family permease